MIGNCPDYCNPQFHYDPHLQTKWKFEISTIIIIIIIIIMCDLASVKHSSFLKASLVLSTEALHTAFLKCVATVF